MRSGLCELYRQSTNYIPGEKEKPKETLIGTYYYTEQKVGITRYYAALNTRISIVKLIRISEPGIDGVDLANAVCVLDENTSRKYRVVQAQNTEDANGLLCVDISLTADFRG